VLRCGPTWRPTASLPAIGDPCVAVEQPMMEPSRERSTVVVHLKSGATVQADRLLVATGRRPNAEAWRGAGLAQTDRGWLKVDPATLEARPGVFGAGPVFFVGGGAPDAKSRAGFDVAVIHMEIDSIGYGSGVMAAAARLKAAPDGGVQIDDYAERPIKLVTVIRKLT
jgi:Pyridine nucleotide-disulphide oxidoreductase